MEVFMGADVVAAAFVAGVGYGVRLAWTQEARCRRWAYSVGQRAESRYRRRDGFWPSSEVSGAE